MKLVLFLLAIAGYYYNIKENKKLSYVLWGFSNTGWAIVSLYANEYLLGSMFIVYLMICLYFLLGRKTNVIKNMSNTNTRRRGRTPRISRTRAIEMIQNAGGRFFTVGWTTGSGEPRMMNANSAKDALTPHGYLRVKVMRGTGYKSVDSRTINHLKINGTTYNVR